ncbi:MAG: hypothetical protein CMJ64_09315 [Planctomycetaceae bacterium]|nr:hypothetical protein [Planctomycetaceae bacterium]
MPTLLIDVCFAMFLILGSVAAIELWCRAHGSPKVSLLSMFGVLSGLCFCFYRFDRDWNGDSIYDVLNVATSSVDLY